ncbi:MAG: IS1/IS6 family transposase [Nitrospirae bacterium]|nr:IS1/IS6 family transposase [Nitrospirota bacterium]
MTCLKCQHGKAKRFGFAKNRIQRYRCHSCRATFLEPRQKPLGNHYTDMEKAIHVVGLITEGMSIRATSRLTGLHKNTVMAILLTIGRNCERLMDAKMSGVRTRFVQADEAWSYIHTKEKRVRRTDPPEWGDCYVWAALDSETKAILSYHVGKRDSVSAYEFIEGLRRRVDGVFQLSTDGLNWYVPAVEEHFGADVHYGQQTKVFGQPETPSAPEWYKPAPKVIGMFRRIFSGDPDPSRISTCHIERANGILRQHIRRMGRLVNAFSKKLDGFKAAVALFAAWYNLCRVHSATRVTPGMGSGITDHVWTVRELLEAATRI